MAPYFLTIAVSYLFGSIPFGYILVRTFLGEDIRRSGSGNIGATNVARSSTALGAATLLLDAMKGAGVVAFALWLQPSHMLAAIAGLFAIIGHSFPVWLKFRGGKGVATAVGAFVVLAPRAVLASLIVFLLTVLIARYVSLGSILATGTFPLFAWYFYRGVFPAPVVVVTTLASLLVVGRHYENVGRLIQHTEPRFQLRRG
jgi:glycerol-3-phosphate acyltransferase PlsY